MQQVQGRSVAVEPPRFRAAPAAYADLLVLAGSVGVADTWTSGLPRALLPLPGGTVLGDVIVKTSSLTGGSCIVCVNSKRNLYEDWIRRSGEFAGSVRIAADRLPRGTAGCIKDCQPHLTGAPLLIVGGSVWLEDDPEWLLEQHRSQGNALTVFCIPHQVWTDDSPGRRLRPAGLFCCEPEVLQYIPETGYHDLKEQLVPALQRAGLRVGAVGLRHQTHQVSDWPTYLHAVTRSLATERFREAGYHELAPAIWCGEGVRVAPDARIVGPALLGHGCVVGDESVIVGPAMLGDCCDVGPRAWLVRTVAPAGTVFAAESSVTDWFHPGAGFAAGANASAAGTDAANVRGTRADDAGAGAGSSANAGLWGQIKRWSPAAAVAAAFVWAFWSNLVDLWIVWQYNADYSAGQLVPAAAAYLVATNRRRLEGIRLSLSPLGLALFGLGLAMNWFGAYYLYSSISNVGMVVCASGVVMALIGWRGYARVWYPLAFLLLMLPLPRRMHDAVMLPLQGFGAQVSASILEIIGIPVERFGHVLEVAGQRVAVAEACSGLRMALAFLIVTAVVAYIVRRPMWQRVLLVLSSVPIALACNVVRIVATAYLYSIGYDSLAQGVFHDGAGLLMMPVAFGLILLELWFLSTLTTPRARPPLLTQRARQTAVVALR